MLARKVILSVFSIMLLLLIGLVSRAQTISQRFIVKNFNNSVVLTLNSLTSSQTVYWDNGAIRSLFSSSNGQYCFQSHEYDYDLGLYLFPSRLYSAIIGRFLQPDPLSQYVSPYVFAQGDPVNFIDEDGNAAKPLILYGEESRSSRSTRMSAVAEDMQKEVDGYYFPLSDFVNGDVPLDLAEWNGNVFIESHLEVQGAIASEYYHRGEKFKLKKAFSDGVYGGDVGEFGFVKIDAVTKRLSELSKVTKTPLKSVTFAGCEGSMSARNMGTSISRIFKKQRAIPTRVKLVGFKQDMYTGYMSPAVKNDVDNELLTMHEMRGQNPDHVQMYLHDDEESRITHDYTGAEARYVGHSGQEYPFIEGDDLNSFANGVVPQQFSPHMDNYEAIVPERAPRARIPSVPLEL